jgi:D-serine deaminase-like pyridoxal phosphate-dependent protein
VYDKDRVRTIDSLAISPREKGFGGPSHRESVTPADIAAVRPHVGGGWLGSPRVLLHQSALEHNIESMAAFCRARGAVLYPHGKTTMSPQLVARQLDAGAQGVTVANTRQARLFRHYGMTDVLIANEVTDESAMTWLGREMSEHADATLTCYVDSVLGVERLEHSLAQHGATRPLNVLVELGHDGGRSGARSHKQAVVVAEAVGRASRLSLVGVAGYEGSIVASSVGDTVNAAKAFCEQLGRLTGTLVSAGLVDGVPMVTAGGSAYFDAVVDVLADVSAWRLVLRSGCYIAHDHGLYRSVSPSERDPQMPQLRPALEVWAPLLSRPEPGTVVVGVGRRDVSFDADAPVPLRARRGSEGVDITGVEVDRLFDQHLILTVPGECELAPGDEMALGISHPCTTFDKWRWVPMIDDDQRIVDVFRTFF